MRIHQWLKVLAERKGSDLYLATGAPPCAKFDGELKTISSDVLAPGEVAEIAQELMDDTQLEEFARDLEMNLAVSLPGVGRFRVNIFRQRNEVSIVARFIVMEIPQWHELGLPEILTELILHKRGLMLFVGATGSGKSTIIRLLCRLYEPQQGRILVDGRDIRTIPMADLRRTLGVVLQDTFLFSGNVADNLRLNEAVSDQDLEQVCRDLGLEDLLSRLPNGLDTELRERGGNLSSGERQLLAVARVAIRNPTVLVMDEATAFMDPSTEATLQADLDRILQKRTAVVIAHRLATVEASDRILVLRRGELIEEGTHLELRARDGLYAQLAELQERGLARL